MNNKIIKTLIFITFVFILILLNNTKTYAAMSNATITLNKTSFTYTGKAIKPAVTIKYNNKTLKKGTDYTLEYKNNVKPGTGKVIITGLKKGLGGQVTKKFTINKIDISGFDVSDYIKTFKYDGKSKKPSIYIKGLKRNIDYKINYINNKNIGKATIELYGIGNYKNSIKKYFYIKESIHSCRLELHNYNNTVTYTGHHIKPSVSLYYGKKKLKKDKDYSVEYKNNLNIGKATIKIYGIGVYMGTIEKVFTITPIQLQKDNTTVILKNKKYKNTKKAIYFQINYVKYKDKKLINGTDYTIKSYSCNYNKKAKLYEYSITIKGKGKYSGTVTRTVGLATKNQENVLLVGISSK